MVASHILSLLSFGEELVPDTLENIFIPSVLTLTVFFAIFDQGCIKLLCPKSWFEPYGEATYWAYVISISYQVCIFIPLGVAVFFLDHNGSYVDLLNSTSHETHGKHTKHQGSAIPASKEGLQHMTLKDLHKKCVHKN